MKSIKELMRLEEADKMKGEDPCWADYEMIGMKMKNGRKVPNCVPKAKAKNEEVEIAEAKVGDTVSFHHELKSAPGSKVKKSGTVEKVDGDVVHVKVKDKYGVKRHQIKMGDLVKEENDLELDELRNVTQDQLGGRMGSSGPGFNKTPDGKAREVKRKQDHLKSQMQFTKSQGGIAGPKGKLPEEVELEEGEGIVTPKNRLPLHTDPPKGSYAWDVKYGNITRKGSYRKRPNPNKPPVKEENELEEENIKKVKMTPQERAYKRKLGMKAILGTVQEAVKKMRENKKGDPSQSKNVKKGESLSGKQEPIKVNPELQEK